MIGSIVRPRVPRLRRMLLLVGLGLSIAGASGAVIVDTGDGRGNVEPPPDFPWWSHVESRLGGTSIVYLGDGWVLTARHVGMGVLMLGGERFDPDPDTLVTFGEPDRPADLIAFRLATNRPWPVLPMMEITRSSPAPGEEVLMIGNGMNRGARLRGEVEGSQAGLQTGSQTAADTRPPPIGWLWGEGASKRWGTNRVVDRPAIVEHGDTSTLSFATRFESLFDRETTVYEAQAATGDSGGGVFKRRDPADPTSDWVLAGVMFTVNHDGEGADRTSLYGDFTHSVDLAEYRSRLIAAVRPACFDEADNDGDGRVDFPDDRGCESRFDRDEQGEERQDTPDGYLTPTETLIAGAVVIAIGGLLWAFTRESRTPQ